MKKDDLINTADAIVKASVNAAADYEHSISAMVVLMNEKMLGRDDILALVGENNIDMMKDNHSNHAHFIASILKNFNAEVLVDTILWVFRAYRSRNFQSNYWAAQLNTWRQTIEAELPTESAQQILPLYDWMQINIPYFVELSDEKIIDSKSMHLSN